MIINIYQEKIRDQLALIYCIRKIPHIFGSIAPKKTSEYYLNNPELSLTYSTYQEAFNKAMEQAKILEDALIFYSKNEYWSSVSCSIDGVKKESSTDIAREALAKYRGENGTRS